MPERKGFGRPNFIKAFASPLLWPPVDGWFGCSRVNRLPTVFATCSSEVYQRQVEAAYHQGKRWAYHIIDGEWQDDRWRVIRGNIRLMGRRIHVKALFYFTDLLAIWRPTSPRLFATPPFDENDRVNEAAMLMLSDVVTGIYEANGPPLPPVEPAYIRATYYGVVVRRPDWGWISSYQPSQWFVWTEDDGIIVEPHESPGLSYTSRWMAPPIVVNSLYRKADRLHWDWLKERGIL